MKGKEAHFGALVSGGCVCAGQEIVVGGPRILGEVKTSYMAKVYGCWSIP